MSLKNICKIILFNTLIIPLVCGLLSCTGAGTVDNPQNTNVLTLKWQVMYSQDNHLNKIWGSSASDVFCVGYNGLILHYDGTLWSTMNSGTSQDLYGIWGDSSKDIFVVGDGGVILHYDGNKWSQIAVLDTKFLVSIWGNSPTDIFSTGSNGTIFHFNGTNWEAMQDNLNHTFNGYNFILLWLMYW